MSLSSVERVVRAYPQIFFACHIRHVPDPATNRLLTSRQRELLDHLSDEHAVGMRQLAAHMGVTPSTMSITVDRLVQRGYVVRDVHPGDRRRVELRLTKTGVRIRGAQEVLDARRVASALERLTPSEQDEAVRGLELLAGAATRMMEDAAATRRASLDTTAHPRPGNRRSGR